MRIQVLFSTFALAAAACGGADASQQAANDPSTAPANGSATSVTSAPVAGMTATSTAIEPSATASGSTSATMTGAGASTNPGASAMNASTHSSMAPMGTTSTPAATSSGAVVSDPGAHDQTPSADNTRSNDRDRHGTTLTPMNQGSSAGETQITANIRKAVVADKTLSFTAKNVKIITVGTKVTLRGSVNSAQERATIEAAAKQTAGVTDVDDQLEVKN